MYIKLPQTASNWNYVTPMLLADGIKLFEKTFEEVHGNAVLEGKTLEFRKEVEINLCGV